MAELISMTYEQARAEYFKTLKDEAKHKMNYWDTRVRRSRPNDLNDPAHIRASEYAAEYSYYNDALEALENQPKWISVEERLPERHGQACVGLYSQHGDDRPYPFPYVFTWYAYGDNGYVNGPHFSDEGLDGLKVHYWMPLPSTEGIE